MILHGSAVQLRMKYDLEGFYNLHVQLRVNTIFYGRQYSVQLRENAILYGATVQFRDNVIWYSAGTTCTVQRAILHSTTEQLRENVMCTVLLYSYMVQFRRNAIFVQFYMYSSFSDFIQYYRTA